MRKLVYEIVGKNGKQIVKGSKETLAGAKDLVARMKEMGYKDVEYKSVLIKMDEPKRPYNPKRAEGIRMGRKYIAPYAK